LGAAIALYGENFNPAISLKALAYFADGDLPKLSEADQRFLAKKAAGVREISAVPRISDAISPL
ncbi:MAG: hypothetical protein HY360_11380, partial [Verrucomicrobia bacterium]|nr:hypothetical protein [Verrucomicrobiota bacterium]